MRLLVTGCARSGTGYAAAVLRSCGLRCGHEQIVGTKEALGRRPVSWGGWDAESSWLAAVDPDGWGADLVCFQVRHPLRVAASWLARGTLDPTVVSPDLDPYRQVLASRWPGAFSAPSPERRILRLLAAFSLAVPRPALLWKVEEGLPLRRLSLLLGTPLIPAAPTPTDVNHKGPTLPPEEAAERFCPLPEWPKVADLYSPWYPL